MEIQAHWCLAVDQISALTRQHHVIPIECEKAFGSEFGTMKNR